MEQLTEKERVLQKILQEKNLDGILITDPYSLRYYTGFQGGEGTAAVKAEAFLLITDSRYTEAAEKESSFPVQEYSADRPLSGILTSFFAEDRTMRIGFEDRTMTYSEYQRFAKMLPASLIPLEAALLIPRRIKTPEEIACLRQAEAIGDKAFQDMLGILRPGMTELEVAAELEYSMKKHGAEGLSFDTIAASGVHSSMPHAIPTDKRLEMGEFLTMDFGCIYHGYCSDMTRTVALGRVGEEEKKVYGIVREAQQAVLDRVKAGMVCKEVDAIARDMIRDAGYGAYFGHGLGHSVGLYIHESPAFNTRDESRLQAGMVITDEPGIYLPGKFGVRIEDMILITEEGCENLASSPKELIQL